MPAVLHHPWYNKRGIPMEYPTVDDWSVLEVVYDLFQEKATLHVLDLGWILYAVRQVIEEQSDCYHKHRVKDVLKNVIRDYEVGLRKWDPWPLWRKWDSHFYYYPRPEDSTLLCSPETCKVATFCFGVRKYLEAALRMPVEF